MAKATDEQIIRKTLRLAEKGRGHVSPNPLVGAVIARGEEIIGQGYHHFFGGVHAEIDAFDHAKANLAGATLYVNLEPCTHHGKQPPCVDQILAKKIGRVVIGSPDPNPVVAGKGAKILEDHGIEVRMGVLEKACQRLNEGYFKHIVTGLPFTTIKIAQTLDGKIATQSGMSKWITSEKARRHGHRLRKQHDAILVGIGTVLADDPELTVRLVRGVSPKRIVLDSRLRIPSEARVLSKEFADGTIVVTTAQAHSNKIRAIEEMGAQVWVIEANGQGRVNLATLWNKLGTTGVTSVLVEGGSQVISSLIRAGLVDRVAVFLAPKLLGDGLNAVQHLGIDDLEKSIQLVDIQHKKIGEDFFLSGKLLRKAA